MHRLVAVGIVGNWTGTWQSLRGNEEFITAGPIGPAETIYLELEGYDGTTINRHRLILSTDAQPMPEGNWTRYRIVKVASHSVTQTTVEITLRNGHV